MYENLEFAVKQELNKILKAKIIFLVRHTQWVKNLIPVSKNNGDIHLCIYFKKNCKACKKDHYSIPPM